MSYDYIPPELIEKIPFSGLGRSASPKFIKGPIPLWWLKVASEECKPSAFKLGLLLFYRYGVRDQDRPITKNQMDSIGLNRKRKAEALLELQTARLITVETKGRRQVPRLDLETRNPAESIMPSNA